MHERKEVQREASGQAVGAVGRRAALDVEICLGGQLRTNATGETSAPLCTTGKPLSVDMMYVDERWYMVTSTPYECSSALISCAVVHR